MVLEGFDGAGKTTFARWIAETYSWEYHKSPEGPAADARKHFDSVASTVVDRMCFYLSVSIRNSIVASERTSAGINVERSGTTRADSAS